MNEIDNPQSALECIDPPFSIAPENGLRKAIENAINVNCAENGSNTPDFILSKYLMSCLDAFDAATNARNAWYGR